MTSFRLQHIAMLLTYSGISFISGSVNHGFFSGERSFWTAALGVVLFVAGALLQHKLTGDLRESVARTLFWGSLLSIGLGFFTGGLQHFPDSPARSSWVVPLGFAVSAVALFAQRTSTENWRRASAGGYAVVAALLVTAGSYGGYRLLDGRVEVSHSHDHDEPALLAQAVTRTVDVEMTEMRFLPSTVQVSAGETIRFLAKNSGQVDHELVLGTESQVREHAEAMRRGDAHDHGGGAAVAVHPGATRALVVTFQKAGSFTMACLVPGHLEAGMSGTVLVAQADSTSLPQAPRPQAPSGSGHDHGEHKH